MPSPELRPLHPAIGAEVIGVDLSKPVDDDTFDAIRTEWIERGILLFRDQQALPPEQHIAFSEGFGELEIFTLRQYTHPEFDKLFVISNLKNDEGQAMGARVERIWHTDSQFLECPSMGSILHAKEVPSAGADTLFASGRAVCAALPEATRRRIDGLRVNHSRIRACPITYPNRPPLSDEEEARTPDIEHPLVRHPPNRAPRALHRPLHRLGDHRDDPRGERCPHRRTARLRD